MKRPFLILAAVSLVALSSCSSVKQTVAKVQDGTVKSLRTAKEKTIGPSQPKLRLTKADPSRFLPEGTSAEKVRIKTASSKPTQKQKPLLAKHTKVSSGPRPTKSRSKTLAPIPELELPPLPAASEDDNKDFRGILPSLDGSDDATFIDVNGETPELPPMELPEIEEENEPDPEASP